MEGLTNAQITPIRDYSRRIPCPSIPTLSLRSTEKLCRILLGMRTHPKSFNSIAASGQPFEASVGRFDNSIPSREVLEIWQEADAVCFDVDSTVCLDEGIDELAEFCGAGKAVAEWTARALGGTVPFEVALAARLSLFKPSLSQVQDFLKRPPKIMDTRELS